MYRCSVRVGEAGIFSLRVHIGNYNPSLLLPHRHLAKDEPSDAFILGDNSRFLLRLSEELVIHQPQLSCSSLSISYPTQLHPFYTSHLAIEGVDQFGNPFASYEDGSVQLITTRNVTSFKPILSSHTVYYSLLPLTDMVNASSLSLSVSCLQDGEEKTFTRRIPVTMEGHMLLSNLDTNITIQPKEHLLSAKVTLFNQHQLSIPMNDYMGFIVVSQRSNRSITKLEMNQGDSLTLTAELPFSGDTWITLFVKDPEGRTLQVAEHSFQLPARTPSSANVFGQGLVAPSLVDPNDSHYQGVFFVQYLTSERDPVSCDARKSELSLSLTDRVNNRPVAVLYSVETSGMRCVISYNFTKTHSSYILSLSSDSVVLYQRKLVFTEASPTYSVSVQNVHPFVAMENETMATIYLSNGILLQFTSPILDIGTDSISLLCDEGYTESSFLIRKDGINVFRIIPMIPSSGVYSFRIFLFNHLLEQTLRLEIEPNTSEQTSWLFWGSGIVGGQAGEQLVVNARKQDLYSNTISVGNLRLLVQTSQQSFSITGAVVGNHIQFQYSVSLIPSNATWTIVTLVLETSTERVTITPLYRSIIVTAGAVDWNHSILWGSPEVYAGELYSFHLNLRDAFSNHLPPGFGSSGLTITGRS